jgi:WD40 repeat protein
MLRLVSKSAFLSLKAPSFGLFMILLGLVACGGGSGGGNGGGNTQNPLAPDFNFAVTPALASIVAGSTTSVSLSATPVNGFSSPITVQIAGLPSGLSASPSNINLMAGTPQQVTLSAPAGASSNNENVTFTATSGSLTHTAQLSLFVYASLTSIPHSRTRYVRTDATTEYFAWPNSHWVVYNPATARFFVTDPQSNRVEVLDGPSETEIGIISLPGAFAIDDTPDHKTLYVATLLGDVFTIDPAAMSVTHRYPASQIGPSGYFAVNALVLADGRLALLGQQGGIPSVDGSASFAVWNPVDNSFTPYAGLIGGTCGSQMGNIGGFSRTVDRTKIILGSVFSDGTLCEVDETTGLGLHTTAPSFSMNRLPLSPDGKYIILPSYPGNAVVFDAHTLAKISEFPVSGDTSSAAGFVISADSKTLFVPNDSIVYAYDIGTHQQVGWFPNIYLPQISGGGAAGPVRSPNLQAMDGTGLLVGPMEEGVGFVDSAAMQTGPVGSTFIDAYLDPATGPKGGGTQTQWVDANSLGPLSSIYFDGQKAPSTSTAPAPGAARTQILATTPPGLPGPADVYVFTADGGMEILPDGFSYGPTVLQVTPNLSTAEGGGIGYVYGYGFGPVKATTVPSDLQITVGGSPVQLLGFGPNAYNVGPAPFPLQVVAYRISPGTTGPVDVTVSTSVGTTTARSALTYMAGIQQFHLPGSALAQGTYDPHRDLYYFTDLNKIQVFSLTQKSWLPPISIPGAPGLERLWGLGLSPDGTKLVIANSMAPAIYVLDPTNPASVKTFSIAAGGVQGLAMNPLGVAISNTGMVYYTALIQGITGAFNFFKLNTSTGAITDYQIHGPDTPPDPYLKTLISNDGTRVYFGDNGYTFGVNTATDKTFSSTTNQSCCYGDDELALSGNQTRIAASSYFYDSALDAESYDALNDREILNTTYVYGAKFSPDGNLLFQPSTNGIDVLDGRLGTLRERVALPVALSANYDALVSNGKDNVLIAITGNGDGIAVLDLTTIPEPPPWPFVRNLGVGLNAFAGAAPQTSSVAHANRHDTRTTNVWTPRTRTIHHATKQIF